MFRLEGKGVEALSTTLVSERFVQFLSLAGEGSLLAFGWSDGEGPTVRAGQGRGAGIIEFMRAQREPLVLRGRFKPVPLTVSRTQAKKFDKVRSAMAEDPDK